MLNQLFSPLQSNESNLREFKIIVSTEKKDDLEQNEADNPESNTELPPLLRNKGCDEAIYAVLSNTFTTCLVLSDIVGVKLFQFNLPIQVFGIRSITTTCGMLTFPLTFFINDIINEYFGVQRTKTVVYLGFAMSTLSFIVISVSQALPILDDPVNVTEFCFDSIFSAARSMYFASIVAYIVGQLLDIWIFQRLRTWRVTKKYFYLRVIISNIVSQFVDSILVTYFAFYVGKLITNQTPASLSTIAVIACSGYVIKLFLSLLFMPLLYLVKRFLFDGYFHLEPFHEIELT